MKNIILKRPNMIISYFFWSW